MELIEHLRRQFAYDAWANREVLTSLRTAGVTIRPVQFMAHILSAERLWMERLKQKPQTLPVWPDFDLETCEVQAEQLARLWTDYMSPMQAAELSRTISYQNSKGEMWTSTVQDVLTHVLMHSAYHRGQIAAEMRGKGEVPAYTDFIHAVRQGLIE